MVKEYAVVFVGNEGDWQYLIGTSGNKKDAMAMVFDTIDQFLSGEHQEIKITRYWDTLAGSYIRYELEYENGKSADYIYLYKNTYPRNYEKDEDAEAETAGKPEA